MGNWLNTYQKVTSQTGTPVTLFTDHAPWRDNPWIEIRGAGRRYRNNGKGGWEIQQVSQSSGTWDPINVVDEEYWTNYVNDIDKKRKETPAQNIFQKLFGIEGKTPEKACGGKVEKGEGGLAFPKGETTYMSPQGRQTISNKKLEGKQLPQGSIVKQTVNGLPGDLNNFGESQTGQTGYSRIIKYGATPMQNDTVYTRTNPYGLGFENTPEGNKQGFNSIYYKKQGGKISDLLNNQEFLVNLEKCGGKMKKKK